MLPEYNGTLQQSFVFNNASDFLRYSSHQYALWYGHSDRYLHLYL